jgi:A/G-specific adenine glycosylase
VVRSGDAVLLGRRKEGGLFGGLWEPPMVEAPSIELALAALAGAGVDAAKAELSEAGRVKHVLTHREMDVIVLRADAPRRFALSAPTTPPYEKLAWLEPDAEGFGVSTLARKIMAAAGKKHRTRARA